MNREKQLTIALLEAKIEKLTGKKVVYENKTTNTTELKYLKESYNKLGKIISKLEEGKTLTKEEEEIINEIDFGKIGQSIKKAVVGDPEAEFKKKLDQYIASWTKKGVIVKPTEQEITNIVNAAKKDKFEGVLSYTKDKKLAYKPASEVKWGSQFAGGGTGQMGTGVSK